MYTIAPYRLVISDSLRPKNKRFCELANIRGLKFHKLFKEFMEALMLQKELLVLTGQ